MASLFETGSVVSIILLLVVIEAVALTVFQKRTGLGIPLLPMLANLAAGGCLMLAIRSALLGHAWVFVGLFMGLALIAHLLDFGSRLLATSEKSSVRRTTGP